jgi:hypothetical protein
LMANKRKSGRALQLIKKKTNWFVLHEKVNKFGGLDTMKKNRTRTKCAEEYYRYSQP